MEKRAFHPVVSLKQESAIQQPPVQGVAPQGGDVGKQVDSAEPKAVSTQAQTIPAIQRAEVLGVQVSVTDMDSVLAAIAANLEVWRGQYVTACNVHATVTAQDDPALMAAENGAVLTLPDGKPLTLAQRKRGFAQAGHVPITELMERILMESGDHGWRHYFYGSTQKTQDQLMEKLHESYPGAVVAGSEPSVFRPLTEQENQELVARINATKADFVWVGLGAPRQELFMASNQGAINALMLGVGGGFDVLSGNVKRAPAWMQKLCLEWLFRLLQEPKRLFKRYVVTNTRFLYLLSRERRA